MGPQDSDFKLHTATTKKEMERLLAERKEEGGVRTYELDKQDTSPPHKDTALHAQVKFNSNQN